MRYSILLSALLLAACSRSRSSAATGSAAVVDDPRSAPVVVNVDNQSANNFNLWILRGGARIRVGYITSLTRDSFRVKGLQIPAAETIRVIADPVPGTRAQVSQEVLLQPGDEITLLIPPP